MKKILFTILGAGLLGFSSLGQISSHALGLRLGGDGDINGAEISYQHLLSSSNRLELDLGLYGNSNNNHTHIAGIYQWVWNLDGGLNWYAGPGAAIGFHEHKRSEDHMSLSIGGQVGIEYNFSSKAPFQLSIDGRPMWDFIGNDHGLGWGLALGIRYVW